ncbi:hypothetical protein R6Q59_007770 [Mikania micrantha]
MKLFQAYMYLLIFLSLAATSPAVAKYAKTGCNVTIPFPFGISANCAVNQWYIVECKNSIPYLHAVLNRPEVLDVNLKDQTVTVSTPKISGCQNSVRNSGQTMGMNLGGSPFYFSKSRNKFVFEGCGTATMMTDDESVVTACSTTCLNNVTIGSDRNNCFGNGCCQTAIPGYLRSYIINIIGLGDQEDRACGSAFLVDETSYDEQRFSDPFIYGNDSVISISLLWTLTDSDQFSCCNDADPTRPFVGMFNGDSVDALKCGSSYRSLFEDNPYLIDGCGGDGVSISMGTLFLFGLSYVLYKWIKKAKVKRQRKRFFKRNGGLLLKQQEEADPSLVDKTIHFTSRELQKATDNFNENRILGWGGQGTVYKGMLVDGRIVAVKKSKVVDESQLEHFINEVVILSQINHRNVVKLLGCCLEREVPVLVSEFIPNGTLYDRLHTETDEFLISLDMRLQIATEVAAALAYLHSATSIPIYHRDVKTTNILLDEKYRAKVSDFGTSRFVSIDQTHLTTLVKGTFGYLDPEYFQSSQFTEKSDVYSFGVVLVELLTREKPISLTRFGENRSLATYFMSAMEEGRVMSIFDAIVIKEGTREELMVAANLAMRCLNLNGKYRPTMKEVASELETLRRSHVLINVQTNTGSVVYREEISMLNYGESSSTFLSFKDSISQ